MTVLKKVTIEIDEKKYISLRKKLLDEGINFTAWVRDKLDKELEL